MWKINLNFENTKIISSQHWAIRWMNQMVINSPNSYRRQNWTMVARIPTSAPGIHIWYKPIPLCVSKNCKYDGISFPQSGYHLTNIIKKFGRTMERSGLNRWGLKRGTESFLRKGILLLATKKQTATLWIFLLSRAPEETPWSWVWPLADSHQESRNLSPTATSNWILPTNKRV